MARSARQIAASRRNIAKAQVASARARKGKHRSSVSQHTYGTGRSGRKNAKRALYGSRRHGISPAQYQRRQQRSAKWKRRAGYAATAVSLGAVAYSHLDAGTKARINADARDYARAARKSSSTAAASKRSYKFNRAAGMSRNKAAKTTAKWVGKGTKIYFGGATRSVKYRHRK